NCWLKLIVELKLNTLPTALSERARDYIRQSLRPNTRRAYGAQLKLWLAWCEQQRTAPSPAPPEAVASYLAERGAAGHSVSTLPPVAAAIKAGHEANGLAFDSKAPAISKTLRGIANATPKLPRQSEPIRAIDVLQMLSTYGASPIGRRDA